MILRKYFMEEAHFEPVNESFTNLERKNDDGSVVVALGSLKGSPT